MSHAESRAEGTARRSPLGDRKRLLAIVSGGSAVAAVGLSQVLAVGALSVTPLGLQAVAYGVVAAFVATTLGGLCATLVSRVPGEVSGPRTSISVIYAALCADLIVRGGGNVNPGEVFAALSLAVLLMGVLQLAAGWARVGDAMKFLPYPVNAGFATGIGLIVAWSQVGPLLGLEGRLSSYDWEHLKEAFHPGALLLGAATAATVWLVPLRTQKVQPLLAGLVVGTALYHVAALIVDPEHLGPTLGTIAPLAHADTTLSVWSRVSPSWLLQTTIQVLPYACFMAMQGIMNSAVVAGPMAEASGMRPNVNRALIGQGAGNMLCGVLAALPIGASPSQCVAAAKMRGINTIVPAASCVILLFAVLVLGGILSHVPIVVLAGLLLTTGIQLIDRWTRGLVARAVRGGRSRREIAWNLAIVAAVTGTFFFGSVPLALFVGSVFAMIVLAIDVSAETDFVSQAGSHFRSTRVWPAEQAEWLAGARSMIRVLRPRGGLFFGTAEQLTTQLTGIDKAVRYCVIDCSGLTVIDATGCQIITAGAKSLAGRGVVTVLSGLNPANRRDAALIDLGLTLPSPKTHWLPDLDHALEWVEGELLRERWPAAGADEPVELIDTQLTRGLQPAEFEVLRSHLTPAQLEAGAVLFERGAAGDSLFVIVRGMIEIRVSGDTVGRRRRDRRLAALGPGCIFGDIALVTHGPRSAAATCVRPAELYELKRDSLRALESGHPLIYAHIMENLNLHLATRLIVATDRVF